MKATKKLLAFLLAAVMLLTLLPAAFATEVQPDAPVTATYTLTINGTSAGHKFDIYQVFTGTLHTEELATDAGSSVTYLSDMQYGDAWTAETGAVPESVINEFKQSAVDNWRLLNSKTTPKKHNAAPVECAEGATSVTFTGLAAGYYIVIEVTESSKIEPGKTYSAAIVEVVKDTTANTKPGTASSQKKVKDVNDSTANSLTGWQDSADYDIGDTVPFQLTATVGTDFDKYSSDRAYKLTFHDFMGPGLTFNPDSVVVKAGNQDLSGFYTVQTTSNGPICDEGCIFHIHFNNLKEINIEHPGAILAGSTITVEYTCTLNEEAVIGSAGNPNEMYITFSNDSNSEQDEEGGKTPVDKVTVFTFQLIVNKVQNVGSGNEVEQKPLTGAAFKLSKKQSDGTWKEIKELGKEPETPISTFTFTGLDDGVYKLEETVTPGGFNSIAPIEFTVTADHDITSDDPRLNSLQGSDGATDGTLTFTANVTAGSLTTTVLNVTGNVLPTTGGMGTTVFYVLGSILAIGAAILLISKKRMNSAQ